MKLKIISGGQTGVDQAALRAAKALGIETGGTMPKGWLTEDGPRPEFAELYGMVEHSSPGYPARTWRNAADADVTLWWGQPGSSGYRATCIAAEECRKPFIACVAPTPLGGSFCVGRLLYRAAGKDALVINVAGSRESRAPGIGEAAERDLTTLFRTLLDAIGDEGGEHGDDD